MQNSCPVSMRLLSVLHVHQIVKRANDILEFIAKSWSLEIGFLRILQDVSVATPGIVHTVLVP